MIYNNYNFCLPKPSLVDTFEIFEKALSEIGVSEQFFIFKALSIASIAHTGQLRADGCPYIIHPIRVSLLTLKYLNTRNELHIILCGALLHDVIEDSEFTTATIKQYLNEPIARLTEKLTRYRPTDEHPEMRKIGKLKSWEKIMSSSFNARLIKSCDNLDNMISWEFIDSQSRFHKKMPRWLNEAKDYYMPLAQTVSENIYEDMNIVYNKYINMGYKPSETAII